MAGKPDESLVGKTFEKCRLLGKLGVGGMGSVYLAEHASLGRKVAVKVLPHDLSRDPEYVARFKREAMTAGRLEHPNIVQIHDVGHAEGRHFIIMQYVDGVPLSTVVEELGVMEPQDAARVAMGVLRGLHHAHEQGIVHRDVKPDNILIAQGDQPKLLDFGLAIETEGALKLTTDGMVVGTPYYLSPEQARGQKAGPPSDIYATGVTLYYLLTGKRPFTGATALAVLNKHINEPPVPPKTHVPEIPQALSDIVLKMMAKRLENRYPTAAAAADDMENFLSNRPVSAPPPERAPWLTRRNRIIAASAAGAVAVIVVLVLALSRPAPETNPSMIAPSESPELMAIIQYQKDHIDDYAAYGEILRRLDQFIRDNPSGMLQNAGKGVRGEFLVEAEQRAQAEFARIDFNTETVSLMEALDKFPKELSEITETGKRVASERAATESKLKGMYFQEKERLTASLEQGDFMEAKFSLENLLKYVKDNRLQELLTLKEQLPELERNFPASPMGRFIAQYKETREKFAAALLKKEFAAAYGMMAGLVREPGRPGRLRGGIDYDLLLKTSADPGADLSSPRRAIETIWKASKDRVPYWLLADLQDSLDIVWLHAQVRKGIQDLAGAKTPAKLVTFNGTGRLVFADPFAFETGGAIHRFTTFDLHPRDIVFLAAKGLGLTEAQAFENSEFARAAGALYLYAAVPERWSEAARWFTQAGLLQAAGPPWRLPRLHEARKLEVQERLFLARKDVQDGRLEAAKKTLADLEAQNRDDAEIRKEIAGVMAGVLLGELRDAHKARNTALVKKLARRLRDDHEGQYDKAEVEKIYHMTLWDTGQWNLLFTDSESNWTWDEKSSGAAMPARREQNWLQPDPGARLLASPDRTAGHTGFSVQLRFKEASRDGEAGMVIDAARKENRFWKLVLHPAGKAELYEVAGGTATMKASSPLGRKLQDDEWVDLACIMEGGDIVCFVDKKPSFSFRADVSGESSSGLWTTVKADFRKIQFRK